MAKQQEQSLGKEEKIPISVLALWVFGGTAFVLIVYLFTPFTHNLDDIKVTLQYVLAPIVWGFFAVALWRGHIRRIHPVIALSLAAFLLIMLLATIFARFPWRAWHEMGFELTILAPFLVVAGTSTNERRFRNMCLFYFLVGAGTSVLGLFHYFGGVGLLFQAFYPKPPRSITPLYTLLYTLRQNNDMLSTILNRDFYAAYLVMIAPMGVALALDYRDWRAKAFFLLAFFLMSVCIMLAFSKDSYMALFLMFVIFTALFAARRDWSVVPKPLWWVWGIGGAVLFATVLWAVREKFYALRWESYVSVMSRKVIWGGAVGIFFDLTRPLGVFVKYLLLGGGPGAFYLTFPLYRDPNYHLYEISNVTLFSHNQYLDLLCEEGILGFTAFMIFLGAVLWLLLREAWRKTDHPMNVYQIAIFASVAGVSIQNIFSPNIRWTVCGFNYWFLLGLAVAGSHITFSKDYQERIEKFYEFSPRLRKTIAVAFFVFALVFEAVSIPYGLIRFNAAKNNNDGLVKLSVFSQYCNALMGPRKGDSSLRDETRRIGLETIEKFLRAIKWEPCFITSYYKLAHVYSRMAASVARDSQERAEFWNKAKATYDQLIRYAPDYSEIHLNYGILGRVFYAETGRAEELAGSLLAFHKAAKMSNKLAVQNYYKETLEIAANLAATPPYEPAKVALFEQTLEKLLAEKKKKKEPSEKDQLAKLHTLVANGRTTEAARLESRILEDLAYEVAKRIPSLTNTEGREGERIINDARRAAVDYCIRRGRYAEALPALADLLEHDPENTLYIKMWTAAAIRAGEPKRCLEELSKLIERNPLDWAARDAAREVLELLGDHKHSLKQALAVADILKHSPQGKEKPSLAEAYYHVAYNAEKANDLKTAYDYTSAVLSVAPESQWGKRAQALFNRILQKLQEASFDNQKPKKQ